MGFASGQCSEQSTNLARSSKLARQPVSRALTGDLNGDGIPETLRTLESNKMIGTIRLENRLCAHQPGIVQSGVIVAHWTTVAGAESGFVLL
jgi:hypothetical protein